MIPAEESGNMEIACARKILPLEQDVRKYARRLYRQLAAGGEKQRVVRGKLRIKGREIFYFAAYDKFQNRANKCVFTDNPLDLERLDAQLDATQGKDIEVVPGGEYNPNTRTGTWHFIPSDEVGSALLKTHKPQLMREASRLVRWLEKHSEQPFGCRVEETVINLQEVWLLVAWVRDSPPYMVTVCGSKDRADKASKATAVLFEETLGIKTVHLQDKPEANN